ncbi:MAG: Arc family DNA-binding protein [Ignavibacteriales bacterium]|nr:Arc family DNA-binding protein [Ignavibacteriales bacterium]
MSEKKKFLLRIDGNVYAALERWAADDLRSINAQIEFLLTDALKKSGRISLNKSLPENDNSEPEKSISDN